MLFIRLRCYYVFFFKQKTAYEMRISDWSSDVCSSDLRDRNRAPFKLGCGGGTQIRRVTGGPARLWRGKGRRHIRGLSQPQVDAARRAALHPLPDRPLRGTAERLVGEELFMIE